MRDRGGLAGLTAAGAGTAGAAATATDSGAACIWGVLRRQYAIGITTFTGHETGPFLLLVRLEPSSIPAGGRESAQISHVRTQSNAKSGHSPIKSETAFAGFDRALWAHGNHENVKKSK